MRGRTIAQLRRAWEGRYAADEAGAAALCAALCEVQPCCHQLALQTPEPEPGPDPNQVQPSYQLYCVARDGAREDLSAAHPRRAHAAAPSGPSLTEMLPAQLRVGFSSTTALRPGHPQHQPVEVSPRGGTLVVFDAAVVPHEVLPVLAGQRVYMGGFFAEERPVPRAWVDGAAARGSRWLCDDGWARMT